MFKYTLAFIKRDDKLLMLNRNKNPWMGRWNGVGGKRISGESPLDCIIREVFEETNIKVTPKDIIDKGIVTWNSEDANGKGMYVFLINLDKDYIYHTPSLSEEGILDWKDIAWVSDFNNLGICDNIPYFINDIINNNKKYNHYCTFNNENILISVTKKEM